MPFGIPSDGFWGKKELAYQHVHMFWAFWIGFAVYQFLPLFYIPFLIGMLCGMIMEAYQHIEYSKSWNLPKKWQGTIRDFIFWIIGGCLNYILILTK